MQKKSVQFSLYAVCLLVMMPAISAWAEVKVSVTRGIHYGSDEKQIVDVYVPDGCSEAHACPVTMWVHGGGWRFGDTSGKKSTAMQTLWAQQGIVMVGVNYRLAPQVKHPAEAEDVASAIAWAHENIARYGGNPDAISLLGHSAGAHLVALVATNPRFLKAHDLTPATAIANVFPIDTASFDLSASSRFVKRLVKQAFGSDPETLADASPIKQVRPDGHYPVFIIAATQARKDAVATSEQLVAKLKEAGTPVELLIRDYPDDQHRQLKAHGDIAMELANPDSDMTQKLWARVLKNE